jgi:hypothetical protein
VPRHTRGHDAAPARALSQQQRKPRRARGPPWPRQPQRPTHQVYISTSSSLGMRSLSENSASLRGTHPRPRQTTTTRGRHTPPPNSRVVLLLLQKYPQQQWARLAGTQAQQRHGHARCTAGTEHATAEQARRRAQRECAPSRGLLAPPNSLMTPASRATHATVTHARPRERSGYLTILTNASSL